MWGDVPGWIQAGVAVVVLLGGTITYIHMRFGDERKSSHDSLTAAKNEIEGKISGVKTELKEEMESEKNNRKEEIAKLDESIRELRDLPRQTAVISESVKHLGERFADHKTATDRATDEIKHGMRSMDSKLDGLAVSLRRRTRGPSQ